MNIQNYHNKNKIKQKQKKENKMDYLKIDEKVKFLLFEPWGGVLRTA